MLMSFPRVSSSANALKASPETVQTRHPIDFSSFCQEFGIHVLSGDLSCKCLVQQVRRPVSGSPFHVCLGIPPVRGCPSRHPPELAVEITLGVEAGGQHRIGDA